MKLKTSFFNTAVLGKDITRFAPVWGLYTILLFLLFLPSNSAKNNAESICVNMIALGGVNFVYAFVCVAALFGDLFKPRLCNALHAMPLRREGWFLTHATAGLLFCIVPNSIVALFNALFLGKYFYISFLWLSIMILQFLFFFGVGCFSVQCAGNHLGFAAVYGLINFISYLAFFFFSNLFGPLLYGIELSTAALTPASPVIQLCPVVQFSTYYYVYGSHLTSIALDYFVFGGFERAAWAYTFVAAAIGVALLGLSLLIYRRRKLESAGDLIALKPVAPVFLVICSLLSGIILFTLAGAAYTVSAFVFLIVGLGIGFFGVKMLLERKVQVFKAKAFLGFGALVAALVISLTLTWLDPFGITRYVPETEDIQSVRIYEKSYYYGSMEDRYTITLKDPAELQAITDVHKSLVANRKEGRTPLYLEYTCKDGSTVKRCYWVDAEDVTGLRPYLSAWQYVFQTDDWQRLLDSVTQVEFNNRMGEGDLLMADAATLEKLPGFTQIPLDETTKPLIPQLLEAMRQDCDAGNMGQWQFVSGEVYGWVILTMSDGSKRQDIQVSIHERSVNTVAMLKALLTMAEN